MLIYTIINNLHKPYAKKMKSCVRQRTERFKLMVDDVRSYGFLSSPVEMKITTINSSFMEMKK